MTNAAIEVRGITKSYTLGTHQPATRLTEAVVDTLRRITRNRSERPPVDTLIALSDVSFDVSEGEVMGVIGRNGAGKSTLLKILARVTTPDAGEAVMHGRVGSLLEVGTGFHPELTGRENIFLSGAILGMSRRELVQKLDGIVEFAELQRFIETPVKRYSSGMYTRLAFAVAAHLDPEILLVDEVLAVGDQSFQDKCLGRMNELASGGRTVVFVSHNLGSLARLCDRCLWLDRGSVVDVLPTAAAIEQYLSQFRSGTTSSDTEPNESLIAQIRHVSVQSELSSTGEFQCDHPLTLTLRIDVRHPTQGLHAAFLIQSADGIPVLFSDSRDTNAELLTGANIFSAKIPARLLAPGDYAITVGLATPYTGMVDRHESICSFRLVDHSTARGDARPGYIGLRIPWHRRSSA